jgi:acyl carrier protein
LESDNHIVITVRIGAAFKCLNPHEYIINPQKGNDYDRLFSELVKSKTIPGNIVHLWGLSVDDRGQLKPGEFEQTQDLGLYSLIYSARAIGNHCASNPIRWGVITNNMQNVTGEEEICPEKSTILGPVKIIPREYANITCCGIDIVHPGTDKRKVEVAVKNLISEFSADFSGDPVAAYRGDYRWTQTFDPIRINKKPQTQRLKPNGVYLVTGGLGGMGFRIAAHLAQTINARLILMDIADFPLRKEWKRWLAHNDKQGDVSQKISKILELEALGAAFDIQKVDVSNHQQMKKAISKAEKQWGKIDGVIHTAGMMDYSEVIQKRTREMIREVMAAKVTGTLILDDIFKTREPHFFVLFSSIGKILYKTKFGQVASNTANEFLDAFAFKKQKQGVFTLTINWNDWRNVGMAARPDVNPAIPGPGKFNDKDMFSISPSEGLEVFSRIIESNLPCAAVSPYDLNGLVNYVDHLNQQLAKSSGISNNQEDSRNFYDRPELSTQYIAPRNETEKTLSRIWQDFFGIKPAGVHDNFFELGGDSLKAISLATIIQRTFDVMVPIAEIFHKPVIEGLAEFIADAKKNINQKMEEVVK